MLLFMVAMRSGNDESYDQHRCQLLLVLDTDLSGMSWGPARQ